MLNQNQERLVETAMSICYASTALFGTGLLALGFGAINNDDQLMQQGLICAAAGACMSCALPSMIRYMGEIQRQERELEVGV